jgi:hypothetical protein
MLWITIAWRRCNAKKLNPAVVIRPKYTNKYLNENKFAAICWLIATS